MLTDIVKFKVTGLNQVRLISYFTREDISLFGVSSLGREMFFSVKRGDKERVVALLDKLCYTYEITGESGLFFTGKKLLARKGLLSGILVIGILLSLFSFRLSNIIITAENESAKSEISAVLSDEGVKVGGSIRIIDTKQLEYIILRDSPSVSLVSVVVKGATLFVNAYEKLPPPEIIDMTEVAAMFAAKDAVVTRVVVLSGTAAVKAGEAVSEGEVLIAAHEIVRGLEIPKRAVGRVYGRVWYSAAVEFEPITFEDTRTGAVSKTSNLTFFGNSLSVPPSPFDRYVAEESVVRLFSILPITVRYVTYFETIPIMREHRLENKIDELSQIAAAEAFAKIPKNVTILTSWRAVAERDGRIFVEYYFEVEEIIGIY
jgi:sporulation protein YqfD